MGYSLLCGCNAPWIGTFLYSNQSLRQFNLTFFNELTVLDDVDGYVRIDITEYIEIDVYSLIDLEDILSAHLLTFDIFNDGNRAIQFIQMQVVVDLQSLSDRKSVV